MFRALRPPNTSRGQQLSLATSMPVAALLTPGPDARMGTHTSLPAQ